MLNTILTQRPRSSSLAVSSSQLLTLPAELLFDILEICVSNGKPTMLATICHLIYGFVEDILYRTVVLDSNDAVDHFHRTIYSKSPSFLTAHVKRLAFTWTPFPQSSSCQKVWDIIVACSGVKTLSLPPGYHPLSLASVVHARGSTGVCELTMASYDELDYMGRCTSLQYVPDTQRTREVSSLTHLRVCEPSIAWCPPSSMLQSFGDLPHLTHLQLARRAYANEDNDNTFLEDVSDTLHLRPNLQMLVVVIFPCLWAEEDDISQSSIWKKLSMMAEADGRLFITHGEYGAWREECRTSPSTPGRPSSFWTVLESARA